MRKPPRILLGHGGGGRLTHDLISQLFLPAFANPALAPLTDSAVLPEPPPGRLAFTTDAFVVDPPVFPGGDLGYLAVCGTVNDLAVAGARPLWMSFALILEEGLETKELEKFVGGAKRAADEASVTIVAGDTKVVPRGKGDGAYAVTAGLGVIPPGRELGDQHIQPGDAVLISGSLGEHGAAIMSARHGVQGAELVSDVAPLTGLVEVLLASGAAVHAMHDPTRGGVATTCNEVARRSGLRMVLEEEALPVSGGVASVCQLLGLDPLYVACEGRLLAWVAGEEAEAALAAMRQHPLGRGAARIGTAQPGDRSGVPVVLQTLYGPLRPLDVLAGVELPRIC